MACTQPHNQDYVSRCLEMLSQHGHRITNARRQVIEALSRSSHPLSAVDTFEQIKAIEETSCPDKVSVYRVLDLLVQHGLVHRVPPTGDYVACTHLSCDHASHALVRCTGCEKVLEAQLPPTTMASVASFLLGEYGFQIDSHMVQIDGICENCRS